MIGDSCLFAAVSDLAVFGWQYFEPLCNWLIVNVETSQTKSAAPLQGVHHSTTPPISSWMSVRILVRSGVKSGKTRHPVCSASPTVKRALIELWSVFSSRMIREKAQAYFISPFVK